MGRKPRNLIGMKFGELTVIEYAESSKEGVYWNCQCSCGNTTKVLGSRLVSGKTKSCGHLKTESKHLNENIGKKFGRLTIVSAGSRKGYCLCKCDCGNFKEILLTSILRKKTLSCGCLQKETVKKIREIDLIGNRFGRWTVIGKSEEGNCCKCRCDCGTVRDVKKNSLKSGGSTSCGCYKKELTSSRTTKELSGQKFGKLFVVDRAGSYIGGDGAKCATWNCVCDCGNKTVVRGIDMLSGKVSSCGCLISKGEYLMRQELLKREVLFSTQYGFADLKSDKNKQLKFDFAIIDGFDNLLCLIEYQGIQHDNLYAKYHIDFGRQQREITDNLKRQYCDLHHIPLFEIWYYQDISIELDKILKSINYKSILCQADLSEGATTIPQGSRE